WWGTAAVATHEQVLSRRMSEQVALFQLTDELHRAASGADIYKSGLDAIINALNCDGAAILLIDDVQVMRFIAARSLSDEYRKAVEGHSPWPREERNPQPICINDITHADIPE